MRTTRRRRDILQGARMQRAGVKKSLSAGGMAVHSSVRSRGVRSLPNTALREQFVQRP